MIQFIGETLQWVFIWLDLLCFSLLAWFVFHFSLVLLSLYLFYFCIITLLPYFTHLLFVLYWKIFVFFELYDYFYTNLLTSESRNCLNCLHQWSLLWDGNFWRRHVVLALYVTCVSGLGCAYLVTCVCSVEAFAVFKYLGSSILVMFSSVRLVLQEPGSTHSLPLHAEYCLYQHSLSSSKLVLKIECRLTACCF